MDSYENILVEVAESSATLTLNRPPLNVLTIAAMKEVAAAMKKLDTVRSLRSIVITGAGDKAFSAGVDVQDHSRDWLAAMVESFDGMLQSIGECDKVVLAAVNGLALGGGLEVILACDLAIAVEAARLGQPEIKLGVFAGYANAVLPRLIPRKKAMEIVLLGEPISASDAAAMGLVNWVVPADQLAARTASVTKKLSEMSAVTLKWCKRSVRAGLDKPAVEAVAAVEDIYLNNLMATTDANEGIKAFAEKRRPIWRNE